jgi:putative ABC transport system substrate-binding protein
MSVILVGLVLAGAGLLAGRGVASPFTPPTKIARVGFLANAAGPTAFSDGFRQGLSELGYVEGESIVVEWRFADGDDQRLADFAAELVDLNPDVLVGAGTQACLALQRVTRTIPIVMGNSSDPVGTGLVSDLRHPGGNITGFTAIGPQLAQKRLELLRDVRPPTKRVAVLWNPNDPPRRTEFDEITVAAKDLRLAPPLSLEIGSKSDFAHAIRQASEWQADGIIVLEDPLTHSNIDDLVALIVQAGLPSVHSTRQYAQAGGLMSYGADLVDVYRRSATYVDKILRGIKPGDLPVEEPTRFDFVLNATSAQRLGLAIPQSVLQQANEVIR